MMKKIGVAPNSLQQFDTHLESAPQLSIVLSINPATDRGRSIAPITIRSNRRDLLSAPSSVPQLWIVLSITAEVVCAGDVGFAPRLPPTVDAVLYAA